MSDLEVSMMKRVGELNAEVNLLKAEVERMEHQVRYWRIEAECDNARWLRCLQELDELRASSFVTAIPVEEYEKLKAENDALQNRCDFLEGKGL